MSYMEMVKAAQHRAIMAWKEEPEWKEVNPAAVLAKWEEFKKKQGQEIRDRVRLTSSDGAVSVDRIYQITERFNSYYIKSYDLHFLMVKDVNVILQHVGPDEYWWRGVRLERTENWQLFPMLRHELSAMRDRGWTIGPNYIDGMWTMVVKDKKGNDSPWPLRDCPPSCSGGYDWQPLPGKSQDEGLSERADEEGQDEGSSEGTDEEGQDGESSEETDGEGQDH
jgi:hypothetical protein